jgi:hypothetical protein
MSAIGEDYGSFKVSLAFIRDAGMGLAYFSKDDASEKYYVMSTSDTT